VLAIIPIGLHWFIIGYKPNMGNPVEIMPPITEPVAAPIEAILPATPEASSEVTTAEVSPNMDNPPASEVVVPVAPAPEK
jgi:hypothetical protein